MNFDEADTVVDGGLRKSPSTSPADRADRPDEALKVLEKDFEGFEELGRGGVAWVYLARQRESSETVVLKITSKARTDDRRWARFRREAAALAMLSIPGVVRLRGFGMAWTDLDHTEGYPYLIMDYLPGLDLRRLVEESLEKTGGPPPIDLVIRLFAGLAQTLADCHARGVVHRDLKPANIIFDREADRAVLVDFGLVKVDRSYLNESMEELTKSVTKTGELVGTPITMAPEQLAGHSPEVGAPADVWGFVASFYFCISGRMPFSAADLLVLRDIAADEEIRAEALGTWRKGIPAWAEELCQAALRRDPGARPTMAELAARFDRHGGSRRGRAMGILLPVALLILIALALGALAALLRDS